MHIKKIEKQCFFVTEGQAEIIIVKFVNALSTKIGDFLSKTIHYWDVYSYIIIRKMLFLHTFIRDSCSVYYYRIESTRKCIRSCSPTPTVSKAHNFFLEAIIY